MTLEQLSAAATQGEWQHSFRGGHSSEGEITCDEHSVLTVSGGNWAQWRDAPDDGEAEFKANGDFVCALVNAYRTGQLVAVQPEQPTCMLCAGKCRGHSLADSKAWEPEPGSQAFAVQPDDATVERVQEAYATFGQTGHLRSTPPSRECILAMIAAMKGPKP